MTLEKGTLLNGRYRIVEILGQGGMGSVYRALDENLSVEVAVKENLFATDEYSRQFRLEAVILANVRNLHLPRVTNHFVMGDNGQYLVMDYIEGEDLRQRMERLGTIPEEEAILIGAAVCDALSYLHSRTPPVLHRDIKPGNIKITSNGEIFLVDFGLAKLVQGSQTTTTGARAMTPGYSPPEQYGTARTDPRSDVYSLGATLYAALSGIIPEDGLARVMDNLQLTPLRKHNPKVSRRLAAAIEKAMEAYPDERYQTAGDFKHGLLLSSSKTLRFVEMDLNISVEPPPEDSSQSGKVDLEGTARTLNTSQNTLVDDIAIASLRLKRRLRRFSGLGAWGVVLLFLVVGGIAWVRNPVFRTGLMSVLPGQSASTSQAPTQVLSSTKFTPIPAIPTKTIVPSPNNTSLPATASPTPMGGGLGEIAFVSNRTGMPQIYTIRPDTRQTFQLTNEQDGACQPDWSPDGLQIVYISPCLQKKETYQGSSLFILDLATKNRTALPVSLGGDFEPAWSPDKKHIAFTSLRDGYMEIYMINLENNQVTQLTKTHNILGGVYSRQPAWNPYGSQLVYTLKRQGLTQIWVTTDGDANMNKSNTQLVQSGNTLLDSLPAWSPDGLTIVFNQTNFNGTAPYKLMTIAYEKRDLKQALPIAMSVSPVVNVSFSPDGQWLVFESWPKDPKNQDIYITTVAGTNNTRLTTDPGDDFDPAWAPAIHN
ncbi:MAG: protein kinase [Chloroflexota bacterium]